MRRTLILFVLGVLAAVHPALAEQAATAQPADGDAAAPAASPDTQPIYAAVQSYTEAFNQRDAQALANHWTEGGQLITSDGQEITGREALAKSFGAYFAESEKAQIELVDTDVRLLSPSVASESGVAIVSGAEGQPSETQYTAIHIQTPDGWKMDRVTETPLTGGGPSHYQHLESLAWLEGEWQDAGDDRQVQLTCRWTTNQNFLVNTFRVVGDEQGDFEGTQVIGWDPSAQTIRSWVFDSDGGFGVGRWSSEGDRWTVMTLNVLPDGRRGSATNVYQRLDDSTFKFSSVGRQVDGELMPSIPPVTVQRSTGQ